MSIYIRILLILLLLPTPSLAAALSVSAASLAGEWLGMVTLGGQTSHHAVKAFSALGRTDYLYEGNFSSLEHDAPLKLLELDAALCDELLAKKHTGGTKHTSQVFSTRHLASTTVLMKEESLISMCNIDAIWGYTSLFLALDKAGAKAAILVTKQDVPGLESATRSL